MNVYVFRGHGGYIQRSFRLKEGQYVLFTTQCGLPVAKSTFLNPKIIKLLQSPQKLLKFAQGKFSVSNMPMLFRNPILIQPGEVVTEMLIQMKDPANVTYNQTTGVWKVGAGGTTYIGGKGRTTRLSRLIGSRKGIFVVDSCRVSAKATAEQATKLLMSIIEGKKVRVSDPYAKMALAYESSLPRRRALKRKRTPSQIRLGTRVPGERPFKRRKITRSATSVSMSGESAGRRLYLQPASNMEITSRVSRALKRMRSGR